MCYLSWVPLQVVDVKDMAWILERAASRQINLRKFDRENAVSSISLFSNIQCFFCKSMIWKIVV